MDPIRLNMNVLALEPQPLDMAPKLHGEYAPGFGSVSADAVGATTIVEAARYAQANTARVIIFLFPF